MDESGRERKKTQCLHCVEALEGEGAVMGRGKGELDKDAEYAVGLHPRQQLLSVCA